jgi:hypothetical protein
MKKQRSAVRTETIEKSIFVIRGQRVMLDKDLAELYGIETKALKQAVKRNADRFPSDFMFILNKKEFADLRSQIVTSSSEQWGGPRYMPMVFTEQGVAMLSSVLRSRRAIEVNIAIMRVFVRLRELMAAHKELAAKLRELEGRIQDHDEKILAIFDAIRQLMAPSASTRKRIGFEVKEQKGPYGKKSERS